MTRPPWPRPRGRAPRGRDRDALLPSAAFCCTRTPTLPFDGTSSNSTLHSLTQVMPDLHESTMHNVMAPLRLSLRKGSVKVRAPLTWLGASGVRGVALPFLDSLVWRACTGWTVCLFGCPAPCPACHVLMPRGGCRWGCRSASATSARAACGWTMQSRARPWQETGRQTSKPFRRRDATGI